jgi:DNA-binding transcriptional LysR family regulator
MELQQVRYFVALCSSLNFTRAAAACNVTQPALTRAIQKLEEELGGPLLQRERNLTQLTELGRLMRPLLEQTLAAAEAAKDQASRFRRNETASLRIGLPASISIRIVTASLKELMRRIADLEIELMAADETRLVDALLQGEIDAAFLSDRSDLPERLDRWTMFKEGYRLAITPGHALAHAESVAPGSLGGETLLGRRRCPATLRLRDVCAEAGASVELRHLGDSEEHLQHFAALGLGLLLVPQHLPVLSEIAVRPLAAPELERSVLLTVVGGRRHSPALDAFIKLSRTRDFAAEFALA